MEANAEYGADMRNLLEHPNQDPGKVVSVRGEGGGALANSWPGRTFPFESRCPSFVLVHDLTELRLAFSDSLFLLFTWQRGVALPVFEIDSDSWLANALKSDPESFIKCVIPL